MDVDRRRLLMLVVLAAFIAIMSEQASNNFTGFAVGRSAQKTEPVVKLLYWEFGTMRACTATIVAPRVLLTAAHCAVDGAWVTLGGEDLGVRFVPHPAYDEKTQSRDIALGILDTPITTLPTAYLPPTDNTEIYEGATVTLIGYGKQSQRTGVRRQRRTDTMIYGTKANQFYVGARDGMPCRGDSGGPAAMQVDGQMQVVGVISRGNKNCKGVGIQERVGFYSNWIVNTAMEQGVLAADLENFRPQRSGGPAAPKIDKRQDWLGGVR